MHRGLGTLSQTPSAGVFWASSSVKNASPSPTAQQEGRGYAVDQISLEGCTDKQPGVSKSCFFFHMENHVFTIMVIFSFPANSVFFSFFFKPRLAGEFSSEKGHAFVEQLHKVSINDKPQPVQSLHLWY